MIDTAYFVAAAALALSALTAAGNRRRTKRTFESIEWMLGEAMEDRFTEESFDESRLSALETKFAHYLASSASSSRQIAAERDKIRRLIADISHQTKTPIANLLLYSELLGECDLPEEQRASVEAIHRQSEQLSFLVDALIKLSRLENGILALTPRRCPVQPLLDSVQERFAPGAEEKGLYLRTETTEEQAVFDPKWTAEALGNLVDNAIKYSSAGGVSIAVRRYELFVRIDVSDTGIGVGEEELPRIFTRFYRGEAVREQEGVGVGLYLAREIAAGEGGYIKAASVPGKGSTFSLFLPA